MIQSPKIPPFSVLRNTSIKRLLSVNAFDNIYEGGHEPSTVEITIKGNRNRSRETLWNWKAQDNQGSTLGLPDGELPPQQEVISLLLKCKNEKNLSELERMFVLVSDRSDYIQSIGNYFVPAFIECGSLSCALRAFDQLRFRNEYSWTSLIHGHVDYGETNQAFELFYRMKNENVSPNSFTFVALLRACVRLKCIHRGRQIHFEIAKEGYETDPFIGSILVDLYSKCGSLVEAQDIFDALTSIDTITWTALIAGYNDHGYPEEALKCFQVMQSNMLPADGGTYVCILKACSSLEDYIKGQDINHEVTTKGFDVNAFVGNTLVDFYSKCGKLVEAQDVFERLPITDVVSWNALVSGYTEHGFDEEVQNSLDKMRREGWSPNAVTLACSIKSCGNLKSMEKGLNIHSEIVLKGYDNESIVGNTLVDMYIKLCAHSEAYMVFERLKARDIVSWNTILEAYAEHGLGKEALSCLEQMRSEGVSPNHITYPCVLKACGSEGIASTGYKCHTEITTQGFESYSSVGNTVVDMYAKCGLLIEAWKTFQRLSLHDAVSWNVVIAGFAERKLANEVFSCYKKMNSEGVPPDALTYIFILKSCSDEGALEKTQWIHSEIAKDGFESNQHVMGSVVVLYARCGALLEAQEVLDTMVSPDVVSWTALIGGYVDHGCSKEALNCFERMYIQGFSPNAFTYVSGLKACSKLRDILCGEELHMQITKKGYERDSYICSSLLDMYSKNGLLIEAHVMLDQLSPRDLVSWTALITGYAEYGFHEEAEIYFEQMQQEGFSPDVILWTSMIIAFAEYDYRKTLNMYFGMQEQGIPPDSRIFLGILKTCGDAEDLEAGKKIHAQIHKIGINTSEVIPANALIDMYGRCGSMVDAQLVFDEMPTWDITSWNTLIAWYARQGKSRHVFNLFQNMVEMTNPDELTFLNLLTVCCHYGLIDEGCHCFEAMIQEYGFYPSIKHQNCMIDLLGRAGQLEEAILIADKMPVEPDYIVWSTLLSCCRNWGNIELGRLSFDSAVRSVYKNAGVFILMANIYSHAQMWTDAMEIDAMRRDKGQWDEFHDLECVLCNPE